jgi:hypothetical protein
MKFLAVFSVILVLMTSFSKPSASTGLLDSNKPKPKLSKDKTFFVMTEISTDSTYGYTARNPIKVGYNGQKHAVENERKYLNGLTGPKREKISYYRIGSCCHFEKKKLPFGGLLDKYRIEWSDDSGDKEAVLFINMYEYEDVKVPVGFTIKNY